MYAGGKAKWYHFGKLKVATKLNASKIYIPRFISTMKKHKYTLTKRHVQVFAQHMYGI